MLLNAACNFIQLQPRRCAPQVVHVQVRNDVERLLVIKWDVDNEQLPGAADQPGRNDQEEAAGRNLISNQDLTASCPPRTLRAAWIRGANPNIKAEPIARRPRRSQLSVRLLLAFRAAHHQRGATSSPWSGPTRKAAPDAKRRRETVSTINCRMMRDAPARAIRVRISAWRTSASQQEVAKVRARREQDERDKRCHR